MTKILRFLVPLVIAVALVVFSWNLLPRRPLQEAPAPPAGSRERSASRMLSVLGTPPDWSRLEKYQDVITRPEFERLLTNVFTTGDGWKEWIELDEKEAKIRITADPEGPVRVLRFATGEGGAKVPARYWKSGGELPPAPDGAPLDGLRIAIDPGHIGGEWARVEERWLKVGDQPPVCEGDMTLFVARLLKPRLEALGAKVFLVRRDMEPVTRIRPDNLMDSARKTLPEGAGEDEVRKTAERLFYRTAEIRARAKAVNESIKPDLVLCLHFNADAWGDASNPVLVDRTHFHLLLNGAYADEELMLEDQRLAMLEKLMSGTHREESLVGASVAGVFSSSCGLPAFTYPEGGKTVRQVDGNPFLWARNLLANRIYECPVVFMEPYVMNSRMDFARIQAGDFPGFREIGGKLQRSIFRDYADGLSEALAVHYRELRGVKP